MQLNEIKEIQAYISEEYYFDVEVEVVNEKEEEYNLFFLDKIGDVEFISAFSFVGDFVVSSIVTDFTIPLEKKNKLYKFANEINTLSMREKAVVIYDSQKQKLKFEINIVTLYEDIKTLTENVDEILADYVFGVRETMEDNIEELLDLIYFS